MSRDPEAADASLARFRLGGFQRPAGRGIYPYGRAASCCRPGRVEPTWMVLPCISAPAIDGRICGSCAGCVASLRLVVGGRCVSIRKIAALDAGGGRARNPEGVAFRSSLMPVV